MTVFLTSDRTIKAVIFHNQRKKHAVPQQIFENRKQFGIEERQIPPHLVLLDAEGFVFDYEPLEDGTVWVWEHHDYGRAAHFTSLDEAIKAAYWRYLGLSEVISALTRLGFKVESFGEGPAFYWRYTRGHRTSPLFPTEDAAWRDAKRTHEKAEAKVAADPGIYRSPANHLDYAKPRDLIRVVGTVGVEKLLTEAGYTFAGSTWSLRTKADGTVSALTKSIAGTHGDLLMNALDHYLGEFKAPALKMQEIIDKAVAAEVTVDMSMFEGYTSQQLMELQGFAGPGARLKTLQALGYVFERGRWTAPNGKVTTSDRVELSALVNEAWEHRKQWERSQVSDKSSTFEQSKAILDDLHLTNALWWFIENVDVDHADRNELFFYLRERMRNHG
jgi:hypothetical protein